MQRAVKKSIGVSCDASMIIKNMFPSDDGEYLCTARLNVTSAKFSDEHSAKVALFADSRGIVTFVIAAVIIAAVAAIVIGAFCCRWAGHRFAWEYDYVEKANDHTSPYITRIDSAEDAASLWHGRARQMSVSSNISGIVMHVRRQFYSNNNYLTTAAIIKLVSSSFIDLGNECGWNGQIAREIGSYRTRHK